MNRKEMQDFENHLKKEKNMKTVQISKSKLKAFEQLADWVVACDNSEYDNYVEWCEENGYTPNKLRGKDQKNHPYALALFALGLKFPVNTCRICDAVDCVNHN